MSWLDNLTVFGLNMFIVFIECKVDDRGHWGKKNSIQINEKYEIGVAEDNSENNLIHLIEPDGLRRILLFKQGATFCINQNVFSYGSGFVQEITVDEKAQAGKGNTRDILE